MILFRHLAVAAVMTIGVSVAASPAARAAPVSFTATNFGSQAYGFGSGTQTSMITGYLDAGSFLSYHASYSLFDL